MPELVPVVVDRAHNLARIWEGLALIIVVRVRATILALQAKQPVPAQRRVGKGSCPPGPCSFTRGILAVQST